MIEGSIDLVTVDGAIGWLGEKDGERPFEVVATLRGQVIGEAVAALDRPDLAHAGFNGGRCGFEIAFGAKLPEREIPFVSFFPKGSQLSLPRSSPDLYCEALHAVVAGYPAAGRQRSVYGGLWTDRTDALQIVAGRARAGLCDSATATSLRSLAAEGWAELKAEAKRAAPVAIEEALTSPRTDPEALRAACEAVAAHVFTPAAVAFLKATFDDAPAFYRPRLLADSAPFAQAPAFEPMSSPAELIAVYLPLGDKGMQFDYLVDSHEWPEFCAAGASRWSPRGAGELASALEARQGAVQRREIAGGLALFVGPGLIHRVVASRIAPALRLLVTPQRVSPLRFASEDWTDLALERGVRGRV